MPTESAPKPKRTRAEINRENAKKSTGPKTPEGKAASSKNALKYGIYSKFACIEGEDPEQLDALREDLRAEHQPASLTEEMLVDEIAHHYWRIRRFRYLESQMWISQGRNEQGELCVNLDQAIWMIDHGLAAHVQRALNSAERSFHKALKTLQETKKLRNEAAVFSKPKTQSGFVPQNQVARPPGAAAQAVVPAVRKAVSGFVPQNPESADPDFAKLLAEAQSNLGLNRSELIDLLKTAA
jgi:hypothetical protein